MLFVPAFIARVFLFVSSFEALVTIWLQNYCFFLTCARVFAFFLSFCSLFCYFCLFFLYYLVFLFLLSLTDSTDYTDYYFSYLFIICLRERAPNPNKSINSRAGSPAVHPPCLPKQPPNKNSTDGYSSPAGRGWTGLALAPSLTSFLAEPSTLCPINAFFVTSS